MLVRLEPGSRSATLRALSARHASLAALVWALVACGGGEHAGPAPPSVTGYGEQTEALASGALLSANGTYGAGCANRAGAWSLLIDQDATPDNALLSVVQGNTACQLTLTSLRTGPGPSDLHLANPPIVLSDAYQAASSSFLVEEGQPGFYANAKLSALDFATDFAVTILHTTDTRLGSTSRTASLRYDVQIHYNAPISYWRLDDSEQGVRDTFSDTAGVQLASHSGETGADWTISDSSSSSAVISNQQRVRRDAAGEAVYYASGVTSSADGAVYAELRALSLLSEDQAGVIGRADPSTDTYYRAAYFRNATTARWELSKSVNGTVTLLGSFNQSLNTVATYRLQLEMRGSTIRLLINNVQRVSVTDNAISAAGRAGLVLGASGMSTVPSDTTGLHLDNFQGSAPVQDSEGTNHGWCMGGVSFGSAGAIAGNANTAAVFDGVDDYASVLRQISDDFSIEFWFKSTQGRGTGAHWYNGAGMVDGEVGGVTNDFGVSLRSDGRITAGVGNGGTGQDTTIVSTSAGFNDDQWHHVVFTRERASGALLLYVDGQGQGSATNVGPSLTAPSVINFGRLQTAINYYAGALDEVAVYTTVLSPAQVAAHYQIGAGT